MLINVTNHPSNKWLPEQMEAATKLYGEVVDLRFPTLSADLSTDYILSEAICWREDILEMFDKHYVPDETNAVLVMGEFSFTYALVRLLQEFDIKCIVTTTDRIVTEKTLDDGTIEKTAIFKFVQFRDYPTFE